VQLAFADSELGGAALQDGLLRIRFAAAAVEQGPGGEAGYLLGLDLEMSDAAVRGDIADAFGRVVQGELSDGVSRFSRIELPFEGPGAWRLELVLAQGRTLVVDAAHVRAVPSPGAVFRASFAC
jgi:hypothetical protein